MDLLNSVKVLSVCMETTAGGRNYSGGLGALYGDTARCMHRLGASFISVTPLYYKGYVKQTIVNNNVVDEFPEQDLSQHYIDTGIRLKVPMVRRNVHVKVWQNREIPTAYGLDTNLPENGEFSEITNMLYGENGFGPYNGEDQRLMQELVLGVGAVLLAQKLDYQFDILHLNEGHGVFAAIYQVAGHMYEGHTFEDACDMVRKHTVFTTHTPIVAGNKSRHVDMILGLDCTCGLNREQLLKIGEYDTPGYFGSTVASLRLSKKANAVAYRHQQTSHDLWKAVRGGCKITYIDNGVDVKFWQSPRIREAYDRLDKAALAATHLEHKRELIQLVKERNGIKLDENSIIIGFARRMIQYKRAGLIFHNLERFERLIREHNLQIIFSGKTHPKDNDGKAILRHIYLMSKKYPNNVIFLQNYDVEIASYMTKGCDVWLANPEIPKEACSTSGMKGAINGVLNLSTQDGWWAKSCRYGQNGWFFGGLQSDEHLDAESLYNTLESEVLPAYNDKPLWAEKMLSAINIGLTECNADKMCEDYYWFYRS